MGLSQNADRAAAQLGALYSGINQAQIETYGIDGLLNPAAGLGDSERCMRVDNAVVTAPSVRVNPPYPPPSIEQRTLLVKTLGAYLEVAAGAAGGVSRPADSSQMRILTDDVRQLERVANIHLRNDLVIWGLVSKLRDVVDGMERPNQDAAARRRTFAEGKHAATRLIDILDVDVERASRDLAQAQHDLDAARDALAHVRANPHASATSARPVVYCEAGFSDQAAALLRAATGDSPASAAARRSNEYPAMIAALSEVNAAVATFLEQPSAKQSASLQNAVEAFEAAVRQAGPLPSGTG
jgi:hypothetical protein